MTDDLHNLLALMAAKRGHFLLESGHHGELWLDTDRLFTHPARLRPFVAQLADRLVPYDPEVLCGPLTGGAFLAQMVAEHRGLPFVYANRVDRESSTGLFPVAYPIPPELADFVAHRRVAVVNDVINAGSAVRGALASLREANAQPIAIACLLTLGEAPAALAAGENLPLETLFQTPNPLWLPADCPLCRAGASLQRV